VTRQEQSNGRADPLDDLVSELLDCGGVLSQMISQMVRWENSGRSVPDLAPIPEVAHSLIRSVVEEVPRRYAKRDIVVAAKLVREVTSAITENIYGVNPDLLDADDELTAPEH
jgi:hypothetical protein